MSTPLEPPPLDDVLAWQPEGRTLTPADRAKAVRVRRSLEETGVPFQHCRDLLAAFKQDAVKSRYADWGELMGYCRLSASPVSYDRAPPLLGQHTDAVLRDVLQMEPARIAALRAAGVI